MESNTDSHSFIKSPAIVLRAFTALLPPLTTVVLDVHQPFTAQIFPKSRLLYLSVEAQWCHKRLIPHLVSSFLLVSCLGFTGDCTREKGVIALCNYSV